MFLLLFFASGEGILTQILQCYTMTLQRLLIIVDPDLCLASLVGVKDLKMGQLKFLMLHIKDQAVIAQLGER